MGKGHGEATKVDRGPDDNGSRERVFSNERSSKKREEDKMS